MKVIVKSGELQHRRFSPRGPETSSHGLRDLGRRSAQMGTSSPSEVRWWHTRSPETKVYCEHMATARTRIVIEETYLEAIMERYGLTTKTAAVALALRHLASQPMSGGERLSVRGAHAIADLSADLQPRGA